MFDVGVVGMFGVFLGFCRGGKGICVLCVFVVVFVVCLLIIGGVECEMLVLIMVEVECIVDGCLVMGFLLFWDDLLWFLLDKVGGGGIVFFEEEDVGWWLLDVVGCGGVWEVENECWCRVRLFFCCCFELLYLFVSWFGVWFWGREGGGIWLLEDLFDFLGMLGLIFEIFWEWMIFVLIGDFDDLLEDLVEFVILLWLGIVSGYDFWVGVLGVWWGFF